ncbi:hypothetical protein [Bacillus sinesaloumensis]|uniref:hypothetical protein n=1 Tax=Litchfieldia sinesaloumensis TaxID=1926280 RepID=UPI00098850EE|nr:hypothetical protein [Bacillus sinesaloumensis]
MKKNTIFILISALVLVTVATLIGTVAYFSKGFTSDNNVAKAAVFDVDVVGTNGETIADAEFNLDEDLYPGMETREVYNFEINRNNTELPVEYMVKLLPSGDLFPADKNSPVVLTLKRLVEGNWVNVNFETTFKPKNDVEKFKVFVDWEHSENDIAFQGKTGNIKLEVVATQVDPEPVVVDFGSAHITLYKDSTSSKNTIDFENITNFVLKNKKTGKEYTVGSSPWNRKYTFEMKDIPVGEYTVHFDMLTGMSVKEIQLGESYKETIYDAESNPLVITKDKNEYAKIVLKSDLTLKEIKPLDDLKIPSNITIDEYKEALPKKATIVDSTNQEHLVDLKWDVRPFVFDGWKKPGTYTITSEFFDLPVNVSNSEPSTRLEVKLNVIFE